MRRGQGLPGYSGLLAVVERGDNAPFDEILSLFPHHPCRTFVNAVVRLPAHVLTTGRRTIVRLLGIEAGVAVAI